MVLAIGQLQRAAGPDQRITTTADQWTSDGSDGSFSTAARDRRHWTGGYRAWPAGAISRPNPEFLSWLVSGPTTNPADTNRITNRNAAGAAATTDFPLVAEGTLGGASDGRVTVPTMILKSKRGDSRLAWWTGDQGVKASVEMPTPLTDTSVAGTRARLQSPGQFAIQLAGTDTRPFATLDNRDTRRNQLSHWPQAALLTGNPTTTGALFHDLAPFSSGLLTNVRAGGFRKDLSMFLERINLSLPVIRSTSSITFRALILLSSISSTTFTPKSEVQRQTVGAML